MDKEETNKGLVYGLLILMIVLTILWTVGISYILATVVGLFLSKEVSTMMGFFILIVISLIATLFSKE